MAKEPNPVPVGAKTPPPPPLVCRGKFLRKECTYQVRNKKQQLCSVHLKRLQRGCPLNVKRYYQFARIAKRMLANAPQ